MPPSRRRRPRSTWTVLSGASLSWPGLSADRSAMRCNRWRPGAREHAVPAEHDDRRGPGRGARRRRPGLRGRQASARTGRSRHAADTCRASWEAAITPRSATPTERSSALERARQGPLLLAAALRAARRAVRRLVRSAVYRVVIGGDRCDGPTCGPDRLIAVKKPV